MITCTLTAVCHSGFGAVRPCFSGPVSAVHFIMAQKGLSVTNYIDDVIGHSVVSKSKASFDALTALLLELGFDISEKKVVQPATKVTCLGVDIDTVEFLSQFLRIKYQKSCQNASYGPIGMNAPRGSFSHS